MIKETVLSRSIRLMYVGGVALGMHVGAMAQDATPESTVQKVEVTGSRIPSLVTEGASPITVLSSKDIKADGSRSTEDLLNNLPQVFAGQGAAVSNGATGTATVNLRNLGADRTLVLNGVADERVLRSYEKERKPHARALIRLAVTAGWTMTGT